MSVEGFSGSGPALVAGAPRQVAVIGAGMVGLSCAWFLPESGVQVTVYDRDRVAAGASWGNAGWLTPALTAPLPEPAVLRSGLRAVLSPPRRSTCRCAPIPRWPGSSPGSSRTAPRGRGGAGWPPACR
jgi:cation diffusion facilitator CzcD-associated flavoprotein CzcO